MGLRGAFRVPGGGVWGDGSVRVVPVSGLVWMGLGERHGGLVSEGAGADGKDQAGDGSFYHTVSSELRPGESSSPPAPAE